MITKQIANVIWVNFNKHRYLAPEGKDPSIKPCQPLPYLCNFKAIRRAKGGTR